MSRRKHILSDMTEGEYQTAVLINNNSYEITIHGNCSFVAIVSR